MSQNNRKQILSSPLMFTHDGNRRFLERKQLHPVNRQEVLENLANQSGLPPIPETEVNQFLKVFTKHLCSFGIRALRASILLSIFYFIYTIIRGRVFGEIALLSLVNLLIAIFLLYMFKDMTFYANLAIAYPKKILDVYEELIQSDKAVKGRVVAVKQLDLNKLEIVYDFVRPWEGNVVNGRYITTSQKNILPGNEIVVLLLQNSEIHIML